MPEFSLPNLPETDERLGRKIKHRLCIATRQAQPMAALLRLCLSPAGEVTLDLAGKLPGRGAHLTPKRAAVVKAQQTKAFARAFKQSVRVPEDFAAKIGAQVTARLLDQLALMRRAGDLVLGQEAVLAAAAKGSLALLITPYDAAANTKGKLAGVARDFPSLIFAAAQELGAALGKPRVTNLALTNPRRAEQFLTQADKFRDFLPPSGHEPRL